MEIAMLRTYTRWENMRKELRISQRKQGGTMNREQVEKVKAVFTDNMDDLRQYRIAELAEKIVTAPNGEHGEDKPRMMRYTCHEECSQMPPHSESESCKNLGCIPVESATEKPVCKQCGGAGRVISLRSAEEEVDCPVCKGHGTYHDEEGYQQECDCEDEGGIEELKPLVFPDMAYRNKINELVREVNELKRKVNKQEEGK
jgi:hypothetical protein